MLPKFSMAASRFTITFFRAMRTAPLREGDRDDHREQLGGEADGERHREEEGLERVAAERAR